MGWVTLVTCFFLGVGYLGYQVPSVGWVCPGEVYAQGRYVQGLGMSREVGVSGHGVGTHLPSGHWTSGWDPSSSERDTFGKWVVLILLEFFLVTLVTHIKGLCVNIFQTSNFSHFTFIKIKPHRIHSTIPPWQPIRELVLFPGGSIGE